MSPARPSGAGARSTVVVLHGPNLNLLGVREPHIYGHTTLDQVNEELRRRGEALGVAVETFQSNHEGALIDRVQAARGQAAGLIVNFGAYTHTSIALRDAIASLDLPVVEVHISNIAKREPFRHTSLIAPVATGHIVGLGVQGYTLALDAVVRMVSSRAGTPPGESARDSGRPLSTRPKKGPASR